MEIKAYIHLIDPNGYTPGTYISREIDGMMWKLMTSCNDDENIHKMLEAHPLTYNEPGYDIIITKVGNKYTFKKKENEYGTRVTKTKTVKDMQTKRKIRSRRR